MSILSEVADPNSAISAGTRAYFQERLRLRLYDIVVGEFMRVRDTSGLTQKGLAARIEKRPEQINRWLASPTNWTIDTLSDLLLGISGSELALDVSNLPNQAKRNSLRPEWLEKPVPGWDGQSQKESERQQFAMGISGLGGRPSQNTSGVLGQIRQY